MVMRRCLRMPATFWQTSVLKTFQKSPGSDLVGPSPSIACHLKKAVRRIPGTVEQIPRMQSLDANFQQMVQICSNLP